MVTLQDLKLRIRSVTNIRKITATMKLVATSKLKAAQNNMEIARPFLTAVNAIPEVVAAAEAYKEQAKEVSETKSSYRVIPITSDRGLCGSVNGSVLRRTRAFLRTLPRDTSTTFSIVGNKGRVGLMREFRGSFESTAGEMGEKKGIRFSDLAPFVETIIASPKQTDRIVMVANAFRSMIAFETESIHLLPPSALADLDLGAYEVESGDQQTTMQNYFEWYLAATVFGRVIENAACEMSARMNSMNNATKNAGEIIRVLKIRYNRGRQAAITSELAEIIGGAEALKGTEDE